MAIQESEQCPEISVNCSAGIQDRTDTLTGVLTRKISLNLSSGFGSVFVIIGGEIIRRQFLQSEVDPSYGLFLASLGIISYVSFRRLYASESQLIKSTESVRNNDLQGLTETALKKAELIKVLQHAKENGKNYDPEYLEELIGQRDEAASRIREIKARNKAVLNKPVPEETKI
ncbi:MAG: hypothetical protein CEO21_143 [Microgenomates group bacterium Gr01-1014_80]|nr:MAG: hypothetical protein CEO21_143 [Microgenomates group bacterium Gr01-1014_80]